MLDIAENSRAGGSPPHRLPPETQRSPRLAIAIHFHRLGVIVQVLASLEEEVSGGRSRSFRPKPGEARSRRSWREREPSSPSGSWNCRTPSKPVSSGPSTGRRFPRPCWSPATFPTDLSSLSPVGARLVVTDIFATTLGNRALNEYYGRLRGTQQKISESGGVIPALQNATVCSLPGHPAIPPFTTQAEAQRLVQAYIVGLRFANPKVATQLRGSSPRILDLVYAPCNLQASPPVPWLGSLSPSSLGDPQSLFGFLS